MNNILKRTSTALVVSASLILSACSTGGSSFGVNSAGSVVGQPSMEALKARYAAEAAFFGVSTALNQAIDSGLIVRGTPRGAQALALYKQLITAHTKAKAGLASFDAVLSLAGSLQMLISTR